MTSAVRLHFSYFGETGPLRIGGPSRYEILFRRAPTAHNKLQESQREQPLPPSAAHVTDAPKKGLGREKAGMGSDMLGCQ